MVRITANGDLGKTPIRHGRNPQDPTQYVVLFGALELSDAPPSLAVDEPNLVAIELSRVELGEVPELQIALRLSSEQVEIQNVAKVGPHIVILIGPV
ncbi:MAG: hypothetical protein GY906_37970 [bacterium]|nr:hypothetical protein [bacterium]